MELGAGRTTSNDHTANKARLSEDSIRVTEIVPSRGEVDAVAFICLQTKPGLELDLVNGIVMVGEVPCHIGFNSCKGECDRDDYIVSLRIPQIRLEPGLYSTQVPLTLWFKSDQQYEFLHVGMFTYLETDPHGSVDGDLQDDGTILNTWKIECGITERLETEITTPNVNGRPPEEQRVEFESGSCNKLLSGLTKNSHTIPVDRTPYELGRRNRSPTIIHPKKYKDRLKKAYEISNGHTSGKLMRLDNNLSSLTSDWTMKEIVSKRRLVRFSRKEEKNVIHVKIQVAHDVDPATDLYVSCIYWERQQGYFLTSADLLHILEFSAAVRFTDDDKKRARRILEAFGPLTAKRNGLHTGDIYDVIMRFPYPKPRNVKRDIKLLPWRYLDQMLEKVFNKYITRQ